MKSSMLLASLVVLGIAALALPARAAAQDTQQPAAGEGLRARLLEKFDTNHDGKLDEQERAAARDAIKEKFPELQEKLLQKFDADNDGQLDDAGRAAAREGAKNWIEQHREELLKKLDANGDGKLDDAERAAAREALQNRLQQRQGQTPGPARTGPGVGQGLRARTGPGALRERLRQWRESRGAV